MDKLRLCANYVRPIGCSLSNCPYFHLCRSLLAGCCSRPKYHCSHSLMDEHNVHVLEILDITLVFTPEETLSLMRCCTLFICPYWNKDGLSKLSKKYLLCQHFHVWQRFFQGRCRNPDCKLKHTLDTDLDKMLLSRPFYHLDKVKKSLVMDIVLLSTERRKRTKSKYRQRNKRPGKKILASCL
ncbi:hypothetical protein LSH36_744g01074 [Paralvinella palmiformis]|uniref:C3H1-type domain-containing protein n=1 Tax=Paralvinella palmiformis TaxID=53620 RepID=A0AAD9MSX5_9ANNE|nr:hypothetical protein LSH36_744g01074 [Paralvinella palmiformis]